MPQILADGVYAINDRVDIPGEGVLEFVFARGWLLEIVEIEVGDYFFYRGTEEIRPQASSFAAFYPAFTLVRTRVKDLKGRVCGIGSVNKTSGLPKHPLIFNTDHEGNFQSIEQALSVLTSGRDIQSIEACSNPSLLSIKAKRLIDENYLINPSISRIAIRLKVSPEHLSRQFKRDFGLSPSGYLHHLRVADATFRLSLGEEIIDISHEVGYNDLSRFYKQFRKATRTSPAICRTMITK